MARTQVIVSDLSGEQIPDGEYAHVRITEGSAVYDLDVRKSEVEVLVARGRRSKRRGRKPKNGA